MILIGKNTAPLLTGSRSLQNLGPKTGNPTGCLEETPASSCKIYVYKAYILWPAGAGGLHRDGERLGWDVVVCTPQKVSEYVLKRQTHTSTKQTNKKTSNKINQANWNQIHPWLAYAINPSFVLLSSQLHYTMDLIPQWFNYTMI